mgnify:CR=1 FL=1
MVDVDDHLLVVEQYQLGVVQDPLPRLAWPCELHSYVRVQVWSGHAARAPSPPAGRDERLRLRGVERHHLQ